MDFPTCVLSRKSLKLKEGSLGMKSRQVFFVCLGSSAINPPLSLNRQQAERVHPLAFFVLEFFAFIDQDLAVLGQADRKTLERARRRPFEINAGFIKTAAVAGAFEFLFRVQPAGLAA